MHVPAEVQAIGTFLASIGGAVVTVVGVAVKLEKILRSRREKAVDDVPTRRVPTIPENAPVDAGDEAVLAFWKERAARAIEALSAAREGLREAAKLSDSRERALVNRNRELQTDLDAVRRDLVVAQSRAAVAERAGLELRRQWREAQGLDSDAPPANPLSSAAITVPPGKCF